jgi:membrane-associated protease RseP (regulator of RpoE activity)
MAALLGGCMANGYAKFYTPNASITADDIAARRLAPAPDDPELVHGDDPKVDVPAAQADGYLIVGASSFHGPQASDANAVAQAKVVGADRVLVFGKYMGTSQSVVPITTPTTQTSFTTGSANVFGSGGMATAFGSATTTSYGTQTNYIPVSIDRYDYLAVYLVKVRYLLGANFRNLTNEEAQAAGTVNGVTIVNVVHGSPAADVGLLPGDSIIIADGKAVIDGKQLNEFLMGRQGRSISFTIIRSGKKLSKTVNLATY